MFFETGNLKYSTIFTVFLIKLLQSSLKVVSATFLLVWFLNLNESTCQTRKNVFYFNNSFLSRENQILEFKIFRFHDVIKCLSIKQKNILLNNLGSKHNLLMKFGQFMSYSKRNNFIKIFYKNCGLKTSSRSFCVCKELSTTSTGK